MKRSQRPPKPLPFTETQIRERAYKLWQEQGESTSSDDNWHAAIEVLKRERSPTWRLRQWLLHPFRLLARFLQFFWRLTGQVVRLVRLALTAENPSAALDVVKMVISGLGLIATVLAGIGLVVNYQQGQERLITDRFAKSVEQLGNQNIHVRLGGIYSLERIARDSPKDHWTVIEVLMVFVRDKSPLPQEWAKTPPEKQKPLPNLALDVKSALTVIGRRAAKNDPKNQHLDLSSSNLRDADLRNANLNGADLEGANLSGANLRQAGLSRANLASTSLERANFYGASLYRANLASASLSNANFTTADLTFAFLFETNLSNAQFTGANLRNADLGNANLRNAFLFGANLSDTRFDSADLSHANLSHAQLTGANFRDADLRDAALYTVIVPDRIKQAKNWQQAHYEMEFRKKLGLLPEKP